MVKAHSASHWLCRLMVLLSVVSLSACLDFSGVGAGESSGNPVTVSEGGGATAVQFSSLAVFAGAKGSAGFVDGMANSARFYFPNSVVFDASGNLFVADSGNSIIRKITPLGVVSTFAGSAGQTGSSDGSGSTALFNGPQGLTIDAGDNLFVADTYNHTIRKITPAGVVSTLAGSAGLYGSADGSGSVARFNNPEGLTIDASGNVYVADRGSYTIRKITPAGVVSTLAGSARQYGSVDGSGSAARFGSPSGLAIDANGNLYVADTGNNTIRTITQAGVVSTLAGSAGLSGGGDGSGSAARFTGPRGLTIDPSGNLYVADAGNNTIRKITPAGVVSTFAGSGNMMQLVGNLDGIGIAAHFYRPAGLTIDANGNLYVADTENHNIRKITPAASVTTLAGGKEINGFGNAGSNDGVGTNARFNYFESICSDASGNLFVADTDNHIIRKITPAGVVTTIAGAAGQQGSVDGVGAAARFSWPVGITVDGSGNLFVVDNAPTVRKITPAGVVTTIAGAAGSTGSTDGAGTSARFDTPQDIVVDANGNLYLADSGNHTIRKITPTGMVSTFAGVAGQAGSNDGTGNAARFNSPDGLSIDAGGNLYVADSGNSTIRKITPQGVVSTIAGSAGQSGHTDGVGAQARFVQPESLVVAPNGYLYVVDFGDYTVRQITPAGVVSTIAGHPLDFNAWLPLSSAIHTDLYPGWLVSPVSIALSVVNGKTVLYVASMFESNIVAIQ